MAQLGCENVPIRNCQQRKEEEAHDLVVAAAAATSLSLEVSATMKSLTLLLAQMFMAACTQGAILKRVRFYTEAKASLEIVTQCFLQKYFCRGFF
jgi:hypothetical protein